MNIKYLLRNMSISYDEIVKGTEVYLLAYFY